MENKNKTQRVKVTMEANAIIGEDSISLYPGGTKILSVEPISSNSEDREKE